MFVDWQILYDNKMKQEDWGLETIEKWARILTKLQITESEFDRAEAAAELLGGWPITHPVDFLALARTKQSQYPTANDAFNTACTNCGMKGDIERDWKHEVVYETANRIGWGKLASATEYFFKTFKQVYEQVVIEHKAGKTFVISQSHQVAYEHTPVQADSPFNSKLNEFFDKYGSKA